MTKPIIYKETDFIKRNPHNLTKLLRSLTKESESAIETLVELLKSEDERIRLMAAKELIAMQVAVSSEIDRDQIQRLIANARMGGSKPLGVDGAYPSVNFEDIIQIE